MTSVWLDETAADEYPPLGGEVAGEGERVRVVATERSAIYEDDGEFHPVRYVRGLARAAVDAGARLYERTRAFTVGPTEVATSGGRIGAGAVVVCANAYSPHLVPLRVRPVR